MFKLVVLCSMIAVCMAAPSGLYDHAPLIKTVEYAAHPVVTAHTQTILKPSLSARTVIENNPVLVETPITKHVGDVVQHIPTAVSHQSSTIVHSSAKHVEPIYSHGVEKSIVNVPSSKTVYDTVHVPETKTVYTAHQPQVYAQYIEQPIHAKAVYAHQPYAAYASQPLAYSPAKSFAYQTYSAPAYNYGYASPHYSGEYLQQW